MTTGAVPSSVASVSVPLLTGRGNHLPTQNQASYHSASPGPSARHPSSCFDDDTEEANVRANVEIAVGHADASTSAVMTDNDNDLDANDGGFPDTLGKILGTTFMASPVLDLAFGAADSNVDLARTLILSPPFPLPPPLACPLFSAAAREPSPPEIQVFSLS